MATIALFRPTSSWPAAQRELFERWHAEIWAQRDAKVVKWPVELQDRELFLDFQDWGMARLAEKAAG